MDNQPIRPTDTSVEESAPSVDAQLLQQLLLSENERLRQENISMRAEMAELRRMVETLSIRLTTSEQHSSVLQQTVATNTEALTRLARKVDAMGQDVAVSINEFDVGRYDSI
ncbi:hypothetical protein PRIPAC_83676 [Pristionchus pacificus]|uniref:Uncharacterized protein n=1 Tax=Pristionchus pacificus TaxID=54126 RepID=A0A454Y3F1_PRIPA|nr:hypothetical protein PRIPAC_83676 [Pristionchus pacificus]|eukprot:PDM69774.1 hypothetical protein PRIPAC_44870 [Pristionchus pacificus]